MADTIRVEVVSATGIAWEGEALSVLARTTEGDIGILANHEPFLASLVPCAAEVLTTDGRREVLAIDGGFISVADNRVSLLSQYARVAREIDLHAAELEFAAAERRLNAGETDEETMHHYQRAQAQVKAARLAQDQARA
ncbi:MAG: F0F1 ATP synthase subunit epsilon [Propionicimonas sp.]|uniref:F0F1 ATP synthase subunit epsilon n=1 Tax=Propionicimonas sp. TaxID=1955623 RepID=UPI002B20DC87|nr:F0F1 ATP synthase subunit epsilon [Propionicimonas sp.]MEA4943159.1 F0F1 ATP synthase subunit epsilon [Propionicimonas sp.]MEA5054765.1 F0F1 ATP synthase subunit epsilon [Propionicimonas sp.]